MARNTFPSGKKLIVGSVGLLGMNRPDDVRCVQRLLNDSIRYTKGTLVFLGPVFGPYLTVDGICSKKLINTIKRYQQGHNLPSTGLIEPFGPTLAWLWKEWRARHPSSGGSTSGGSTSGGGSGSEDSGSTGGDMPTDPAPDDPPPDDPPPDEPGDGGGGFGAWPWQPPKPEW